MTRHKQERRAADEGAELVNLGSVLAEFKEQWPLEGPLCDSSR